MPDRNTITSLIAFCSSHASAIRWVRFGPSPWTSISRPGCCSMIVRMSVPKCATIRSAIIGPIPLISPEPR